MLSRLRHQEPNQQSRDIFQAAITNISITRAHRPLTQSEGTSIQLHKADLLYQTYSFAYLQLLCTICCAVHNSLTKGRGSSSLIQGWLSHTEINPLRFYKEKKKRKAYMSIFSNYFTTCIICSFIRFPFYVSVRHAQVMLSQSCLNRSSTVMPAHNIWPTHTCHIRFQKNHVMFAAGHTPNYRTWKLNIVPYFVSKMRRDSIRKPFFSDLISFAVSHLSA